MKSYFQKLYNETGKKPFTFLNCALCVLLPIVAFLLFGITLADANETLFVILVIVALVLCWGGNVFIQFNRFGNIGKALWLMFLNMLASIAFFCKLILFPLIALCFKMMSGMTDIQNGDFSAANNNLNNARSGKIKASAFNWFRYDGTTVDDIQVGEEQPEDYTPDNLAWSHTLNRSYTAEEDLKAQNMGFKNAKDAENQGRISDIVQ